jgi:fructose-bisphosphate aldolase, class II
VDLRAALADAERRRIALGHFNVSELATLRGVVRAADEAQVPVLVGVSEGERAFVGVREIAAVVRALRAEHAHPIFLNADHTHSLAAVEEAARAAFDQIIFDGSALSFEENVRETRRAVEAIRSVDPSIVVEGEIGYIGSGSEILTEVPKGVGLLTAPAEAREFVAATGVDVLAPAVGNMHGLLASMVRGDAQKRLDIARIKAIKEHARVPMTLHGGSGTNDEDLRQAVQAGMTIVHINTELRLAWRGGVEAALAAHPHEVAPYRILADAVEAVRRVVAARLRLFSS